MDVTFIISNPNPHYVHKAFADSVCDDRINCLLYKKRSILFPFLTLKAFFINFFKIKNSDSFLLVGGIGLHLAFLIKLVFWRKKIILLNADPFFYDLKNNFFIIKLFYRLYLKTLTGIICNSYLNQINAQNYFVKNKIKVVYPFLRDNILMNKKISISNSKNLVYVGRESNEKNIPILISFVEKYPEYTLFLIGNFLIKKNKNPSNVKYLGVLKANDLVKELKNMDYGFLISKYDSFGITPLEFILNGVFPIVSNNCGSKEIFNSKLPIITSTLSVLSIKKKIETIDEMDKNEILISLQKNVLELNLIEKNQVKKFKEVFLSLLH